MEVEVIAVMLKNNYVNEQLLFYRKLIDILLGKDCYIHCVIFEYQMVISSNRLLHTLY